MSSKSNHTDERGTITDLLVTPEYSVTHITFKKGAVRGNHYHEETSQKDFVLKGSFLIAQGTDRSELAIGQSAFHNPCVPHAYKALEDSELLSICFGKRRGEHYEEDTFKLDIPLL